MMDTPEHDIIPRRGEAAARLVFTNGCAPRVTVRRGAPEGALAAHAFATPRPEVEASLGEVRVTFPGLFRSILQGLPKPGEVRLASGVSWSVEIRRGVARATLDLRGLDVAGVRVRGGASDLDVLLDAPKGVVPIVVEGGASSLRVRRPKGAAVRLEVSGGASHVELDGDSFGAVGGPLRMGSAGAAEAPDRFLVEVRGGASSLVVEALA